MAALRAVAALALLAAAPQPRAAVAAPAGAALPAEALAACAAGEPPLGLLQRVALARRPRRAANASASVDAGGGLLGEFSLISLGDFLQQEGLGEAWRPKRPKDHLRLQAVEASWWKKHHSSTSVPFSMLVENLDRSRLVADASLRAALETAVCEAVAEEVGEEGPAPSGLELLPARGDVVVALVLNTPTSAKATELQIKLSNSETLGPAVARHLANVSGLNATSTGPVEVSDIVVPTVAVSVRVCLEIPAIAALLILATMAGLHSCRTKAQPQAAAASVLDAAGGGGSTPSSRAGSEESDLEQEKLLDVVSIPGLFKLATPMVRLQIYIAVIFSIAFGVVMPLQFLYLRNAMKAIFLPNDDGTMPPQMSAHTERDAMIRQTFDKYLVLAVILFVTKTVGFLGIESAANHQGLALRRQLFLQLLRKGPAWLAERNAAELADQFATDVQVFQNGIGEHFTNLLRVCAMAISCLVLGIMNEPRTGLILAVALPVTGYCISAARDATLSAARGQQQSYMKAGGVAGRALAEVRLVLAFNGQSREVQKYQNLVTDAEAYGVHAGLVAGWSWGTAKVTNLCTVAIGFYAATFFIISGYRHGCWQGGPARDACMTGGTILASIFLMTRCSAMTLASLPESVSQMAAAQCAAARAFALLGELGGRPAGPGAPDPRLCCHWQGGEAPNVLLAVKGSVSYEGVVFAYPGSCNGAAILNGFTAHVPCGSTAAFVGLSGSGKSTALSLLLRFYDPQAGCVKLDGHDLRTLSLPWLRSRIALVDQNPVLFGCSILENILYGREDATKDEAKNAARTAGAHSFIVSLPDGYATNVGERGSKLSGGQKQRIAIARALVRVPAVLLLDEATSALDVESERVLQRAMSGLLKSAQWTTLVVAHRLSTIRDADLICVLQDGRLVEEGTHSELLKRQGAYATLVQMQFSQPETPRMKEIEELDEQQEAPTPEASPLRCGVSVPRLPLCDLALEDTKDVSRVKLLDVLNTMDSISSGDRGVSEFGEGHSVGSWRRSITESVPSHPGTGRPERCDSFPPETARSTCQQDGVVCSAAPLPLSSCRASARKGAEKAKEASEQKVGLWRLLRLHREDKRLLLPALLATAFSGAVMPVFGRLFAETINDLNQAPAKFSPSLGEWWPSYNARATADAALRVCVRIEGLGVLMFLAALLGHWGLNKAGEQLVRRLRVTGFRAMLHQEVEWLESQSVGGLAEQLACDVPLVKELTCEHLGSLVQSAAMVIVGLIIMFRASILLTLIIMSMLPATFAVSLLLSPYLKRSRKRTEENASKSTALVSEGLDNIRTVAAFGLEERLVQDYVARQQLRGQDVCSLIAIVSKSGPAAIALLIGSAVLLSNHLIQIGMVLPMDVMRVLMPLIWCNTGVTRGAGFFTEKDKAMAAVHDVLQTIDRAPTSSASKAAGLQPASVFGKVEFRNVCFKYASRPDMNVLIGFTLDIAAKSTVALVGRSGSGKSTVVSLVLRFYDPQVGAVMLDGWNLRDLQTYWLRERIGLVQQEPTLFGCSVLENIRYGNTGATIDEVEAAARLAGAHDFIVALKHGYNTDTGDKGAQLSGGQKQRIAIARAIVRKPAVLLLDEPTSGLDTESERVVQASLQNMMQVRQQTTIIVAHRLSTIRNADMICVVDMGQIVEKGSHQELLSLPDGHYRKLVNTSAGNDS